MVRPVAYRLTLDVLEETQLSLKLCEQSQLGNQYRMPVCRSSVST